MINYQKKSNLSKFLESWPVLFLLALLVFFIGWGVIGLLGGYRDTIRNKNIAESKVLELEERKLRLTADIADLGTDKGKEKIFRENYGLAKEGEEVIVVVEDKSAEKKDDKGEAKGFFGIFKKKVK